MWVCNVVHRVLESQVKERLGYSSPSSVIREKKNSSLCTRHLNYEILACACYMWKTDMSHCDIGLLSMWVHAAFGVNRAKYFLLFCRQNALFFFVCCAASVLHAAIAACPQ